LGRIAVLELVDKAVALLCVLRREDIEALPPAERRRLADTCRHVAGIAEPPSPRQGKGVLSALQAGERSG
jgi:hypothetical protein